MDCAIGGGEYTKRQPGLDRLWPAPHSSLDGFPSRYYRLAGMKSPVYAVVGRPREFDVEEALAAALKVFWRKGYEAATLSDLTEAMGVTRPSLYCAFGNKEELFKKALDLYEREKLAFIDTALSAPTAYEAVKRMLLARAIAPRP